MKRDLLIWVWEGLGRNWDDEQERVNRERVFWTCSRWQLGRRTWGWSYQCPIRFGTRSSGKFRIWPLQHSNWPLSRRSNPTSVSPTPPSEHPWFPRIVKVSKRIQNLKKKMIEKVGTWRMKVRLEEDAKAMNWRRNTMKKERGKRAVIILDATRWYLRRKQRWSELQRFSQIHQNNTLFCRW